MPQERRSPDDPGPGWRWACNQCGSLLDLQNGGAGVCPIGACALHVRAVTARKDPEIAGLTAVPVAWLQPLGNGACANHPEAPATGVCERCGDLVCAGCSRFMGDRRYCAPCVAALRGVEGRRTSGRVWWMAGAWSVFLLVLIVLWAVLALAR